MGLNLSLIAFGSFLLLISIILIADGENLSNFRKTHCIIRDKTLVFKNYTCVAKALSREKTVLNINGYLKKPINSMIVHLQFFKKFNVIYRPFLVNVTENFCERFEKKTRSPYLNILLNIGQRYSNLNHTCPYNGWIGFKDLELDLSSLKLLLPDGEYRLDIEPFVNDSPTPSFVMQFFLEFAASKFGRK